jgi:hypothetical protein
MTAADFLRFVIIISLGIVAFITFLVAGTIVGLMWLDSWSCGMCKQSPVGLYILGVLGILLLISIGMEASEAYAPWESWIRESWVTLVVVVASVATYFLVLSWWLWV